MFINRMRSVFTLLPIIVFGFLFGLFNASLTADDQITTPTSFFGFKPGTDRKIIRWDRIVKYFYQLEKESKRLKVINMGPSTMGHPFLVVIISGEKNLNNLKRLQEINWKISNPEGIDETAIKKLIQGGKAVICQSMSLHATEIGGTQVTPELTHELITREDPEARRIRNKVLFFLIPSFNPDGQIWVTDWYRKTVGTKYEGTGLPWLYQRYAGHDNNRDGDFLNLVESKHAAKIMYRDWPPQAFIDHHHMGSYGARLYVPPYCEPIRPYADPLIWREISWYGAHIAYKLEENGKKGILNAAMFPGWGHFGWHWITPFHNIAGMLTESASAKLATPLFIHPEQLRAGGRAFPEYEAQSTFPSPWPGGWWRLSDIMENKKISAIALLDMAAKNKDTVLHNAYLKAKNQTQRGADGRIKALIIPAAQHDAITAVKMINTLLKSGIKIQKAHQDFTAYGKRYSKGSYIISLAQPKMGLIRNLLVKTRYADNAWTRGKDNWPLRPYDLATHTMHEFMGVKVDPVNKAPGGNFSLLTGDEPLKGRVERGGKAYILDGRLNNSYLAVNLLLDKKISPKRLDKPFKNYLPGDFIIQSDKNDILLQVAKETGVDFKALNTLPKSDLHRVKRGRLGMYRRYWGGNMDEGWTRLLLENFKFPYKSLRDKEIKKGNLNRNYDTIILPHDRPSMIKGVIPARWRRWISTQYPPEYKSGIDKGGITQLKKFVQNGGTLVAIGGAGLFAIEEFGLKVNNALERIQPREFFCAGSTLKVRFDNTHPLGYGMPAEGLALFSDNPVFEIIPGRFNEKYQTIVRYQKKDILQSGWLIGEKKITGKPGMVYTKFGKGEIVLIGFRAQHRFQTHATFKLLFNTIIK